jgi:hypothetical protein
MPAPLPRGKLVSGHRALFAADANLRRRTGQFLTALLPPKPRRLGRPGRADVTIAIRLLRKLRRQYPNEQPPKIWQRIYPQAIPNYGSMPDIEKADARQELRERVRWSRRARTRKAYTKRLSKVRTLPRPDSAFAFRYCPQP